MHSDIESDIELLNELAIICKDSMLFYADFSTKIDDLQMQLIFDKILATRESIALNINRLIKNLGGEPSERSGICSKELRRVYADIKVKHTHNASYGYFSQLEGLENTTLKVFKDSKDAADSISVKILINNALLLMNATYGKIKVMGSIAA